MRRQLLCAAMVAATLMSPPLVFAAETASTNDAAQIQVARPSDEYSGWSYWDVVDEFTQAGFTNIELVPIGDLNVATQLVTHDGTIESVTVGESTGFTREATFPADTKVVITYHTFPDTANQINYDAAKALYDAGEYAQAKEAFDALGDYSDSKEMALHAQEELSAQQTTASDPNAQLIAVPASSADLVGKKYWEVQEELVNAGFTNVTLNPIGDMKISITGGTDCTVTGVAADGQDAFTADARYVADTPIIISFRTFQSRIDNGDFATGTSEEAAEDSERIYLGKAVNTGLDNGYSESKQIVEGDPHFGWTLGEFSVTGFTRDTTDPDDGSTVILKNVGDTVTLWFTLEQNISHLDGDASLTVADDNNGYCNDMEVGQTDMGRGTLLIRKTDYQGHVEDTQIYTDYLAAKTVGADTKVQLFEEGDYEVTLLYEISKTEHRVGDFAVAPSYNNYRISFKFKVRNSNCMVYPFDVESGSELADGDTTTAGFKLDLARSRYLDIDIKRANLKDGENGETEDVRFNTAAKDGDEYTTPGVYHFTVKNKYTGEETEKTIYVETSDESGTAADAGAANKEASDDKK